MFTFVINFITPRPQKGLLSDDVTVFFTGILADFCWDFWAENWYQGVFKVADCNFGVKTDKAFVLYWSRKVWFRPSICPVLPINSSNSFSTLGQRIWQRPQRITRDRNDLLLEKVGFQRTPQGRNAFLFLPARDWTSRDSLYNQLH